MSSVLLIFLPFAFNNGINTIQPRSRDINTIQDQVIFPVTQKSHTKQIMAASRHDADKTIEVIHFILSNFFRAFPSEYFKALSTVSSIFSLCSSTVLSPLSNSLTEHPKISASGVISDISGQLSPVSLS